MIGRKQNMGNNLSQTGSVKIVYLAVLAVLGLTTGFLAWQNWSLKKQIPAPAPPAASAPAPAPQAAVVPPSAPEPTALPKKRSAAPTAKRNYNQAVKELPAAIPAPVLPAPAPVARVEPTDVTPAEPLPYPPMDSLTPAVPAKPAKVSVTVPSGTMLTVRLLDTLNTDRNQSGDRFRASLEDPIVVDGNVALPRGTTVEGRIVEAQQAGRVSGVAQLALELSQIQLPGGETAVVQTDTVRREGQTSTGSDAAKVGVGSVLGAVIGAVAGGGKGAAIGAATGAGAGTADVLLTRGKPLVLSQETVLSFQLNAPVTLQVTPGQDADLNQPQSTSSSGDWNGDRPVLRRRRGQYQ
jgi:hypothetical protein